MGVTSVFFFVVEGQGSLKEDGYFNFHCASFLCTAPWLVGLGAGGALALPFPPPPLKRRGTAHTPRVSTRFYAVQNS